MAVQLFESGDYAVGALLARGGTWFRAADVTRILGYANCSQAVRKNVRPKHIATLIELRGVSTNRDGVSTNREGVSTEVSIYREADQSADQALWVSEPGLYALILRSRKVESESFQDWVTEEILPQIRRAPRGSHTKQQLSLMDEKDLHYKVIDFLHTYHQDAIIVAGLGELQDTSEKRIDAWRKGYTKGQPDIMILNKHAKYTGLALELKTPACTGVLRPAQKQVLDRLHASGWQTLVSNNYDEICNEIRDYFRHTREMCGECSRWVRCDRMEAHVIAHTAAAEEEPVSLP